MEFLAIVVIAALIVFFMKKIAAKPNQSLGKQSSVPARNAAASTAPPSKESDRWGRDDDFEPGPNQDNWERFSFHEAKVVPGKGRYHIIYVDQKGLATERDIDIKRVYDAAGSYAADAFCHLRNEHRTFIDERIKKAVNLDTGEIVGSLARDAIKQFADSGEGVALTAIDREWMAAAILSFVCRADGRMLKAERAIVADYLKRRCPELSHDDAALDAAIKTIGEPDQREFKRIIADLKATGDRERLVDIYDCAKRIVGTQKTVDPMEKAALELLEKACA